MSLLDTNPHLPPAPPDGRHHGRGRCDFCGAYSGSDEWYRPCQGQWAESGKMRMHAANLWLEDLLKAGGPVRQIIMITSRQLGARRTPGVLFSTDKRYYIQLECGHERDLTAEFRGDEDYNITRDLHMYEALGYGKILEAACIEPRCPMKSLEEHIKLNSKE